MSHLYNKNLSKLILLLCQISDLKDSRTSIQFLFAPNLLTGTQMVFTKNSFDMLLSGLIVCVLEISGRSGSSCNDVQLN